MNSSLTKLETVSFNEYNCERAKNDVFLNYSFEDIGKSFVSHLKGGLIRNGFTISDHTMLPIGQDESSELLKAIEESGIYVVVFSVNYPFSIECLDELVFIMDCLQKFKKRKVFPIFFNVDPSHVRSQQGGSFMEAFQAHENNFDPKRVQKWTKALKDAGQLSGLTLQNGDEEDFIQKILKKLNQMQNPLELFDATHPVGIESRARDIISKLRLGENVFTIVAVLGIGGSGKTTIVKAVFDRIVAEFDAYCFIENIHDYKNSFPNWKVVLQQEVISRLIGNHQFYNVGSAKIKKIINSQKVLLVLDDVDNYEQLQALGIHLASFGCGSRIIVTTRDRHSLSTLPYTSYEISLLNTMESFELFSRLAFGKDDNHDRNFVNEIVCHAEGLPLVLEVWGRHFKCHERKQWSSILETLKRIPHEDVQKKLQISYDSLSNRAKKLFLDIACFFAGRKKDFVIEVLHDEDSGFFLDIEIQYLVDKGLLKIDTRDQAWQRMIRELCQKISPQENKDSTFFPDNEIEYRDDKSLFETDDYNLLVMHHAIKEMGQEVVRQENEDEPGQRTRLWDHRDLVRVLRDCSGTKSVEGILLNSSDIKECVTVHVEAFKKMGNLRFVQLYDDESHLKWSSSSNNVDISSFSFKKLKYLEWKGFPWKCLDNIDMGNVVVIKLQRSKLEKLWEGFKSLKKLRILDVSHSSSLTKSGNFTGLEKLEVLNLSECDNLEELDSSIGCLIKLVVLDLSRCTRLDRFPCEMIGMLRSLQVLRLRSCRHIGLESDEVIDTFLSSLKECCLTFLDLTECNIFKISDEVGSLDSLKYLNLGGNGFPSLPDNLCQLHELRKVDLYGCSNLTSIPNLPPSIEEIKPLGCISLVTLPSNTTELQFLKELRLVGCFKLEPEGLMKVTGLRNLRKLHMRNCNVSHVSSEIGNLVSLRKLDLSENTFPSLPDSFSNLSKLVKIKMNDCSRLRMIPNLPPSIEEILALNCISLVNLPSNMSELQFLRTLLLSGCSKLEPEGFMKVTELRNLQDLCMRNCNVSQVSREIENLVSLEFLDLSENTLSSFPDNFINLLKLEYLQINNCSQLKFLPFLPFLPPNLRQIEASQCWSLDMMPYDAMLTAYIFRSIVLEELLYGTTELCIGFSGKEIPEWFSYQNTGDVLSFVAPIHLDKKICGVVVCATFDFKDKSNQLFILTILNKTKETSDFFGFLALAECSMYAMFYPLNDTSFVVEAGDIVHLQYQDKDYTQRLSLGLRLIYEGDVVDSALVTKHLIKAPKIPVPLEIMTATS